MKDLKLIMHDDVQLLDWGEGRGAGPWIKLRLRDPALLDAFRGMDTATQKKSGHILSCTLVEGDLVQMGEDELRRQKHGSYWGALMRSSFFLNVPVLEAIGPESAFEEFVRRQPACIGPDDWDEDRGEIRNQPAHVRRVSKGSGTAHKPPYFAVPLSAAVHREQHQHGEAAVMRNWPISEELESPSEDQARSWFDRQAEHMQREWGSRALMQQLDAEASSRGEINPELVIEWCELRGVKNYLPRALRNTE